MLATNVVNDLNAFMVLWRLSVFSFPRGWRRGLMDGCQTGTGTLQKTHTHTAKKHQCQQAGWCYDGILTSLIYIHRIHHRLTIARLPRRPWRHLDNHRPSSNQHVTELNIVWLTLWCNWQVMDKALWLVEVKCIETANRKVSLVSWICQFPRYMSEISKMKQSSKRVQRHLGNVV